MANIMGRGHQLRLLTRGKHFVAKSFKYDTCQYAGKLSKFQWNTQHIKESRWIHTALQRLFAPSTFDLTNRQDHPKESLFN